MNRFLSAMRKSILRIFLLFLACLVSRVNANVEVAGVRTSISWNPITLGDITPYSHAFTAWIAEQVDGTGNIPRGAGPEGVVWIDEAGYPNQADGRYANYNGRFDLEFSAYIAPNVAVAFIIGSVQFQNGKIVSSTIDPEKKLQINTGFQGDKRLKKVQDERLAKIGGPVQLPTGAESAERPLFSFSGARNWGFTLSYNSTLANKQGAEGSVGFGWTHPFQSRVAVQGANLVYETDRTRDNVFTPKPNESGTFVSDDDAMRHDEIVAQPGGGWLLKRRDQSAQLFDSTGRLTEDRDRNGRKLVLAYDGSGNLLTITDPVSATSLTFAYIANSIRIGTITDATNAAVTLEYNGSSILSRITNQNGKQTSFTYGAGRELLTLSDHNGATLTANTFDELGRVTAQHDGVTGNQPLTFQYEEHGLPGNPIDDPEQPERYLRAAIPDARYYYLTSYTLRPGYFYTYAYDFVNRTVSATYTDPAGTSSSTLHYDAAGNGVSATDTDGETAAIDPRFIVTATDRNGQTAIRVFEPNLLLRSVTNALNETTRFTYDAQGNTTSITDPLNRVTQFTYDSRGNVLTTTNPAGKVTTFTYDARNNLLTATDPANKVVTRTYDSANNLLTETDSLNQVTTWTYNANAQPLTMTLPRGGVTQFAYAAGRLSQITDPNGVVTKFSYDANGRTLYREDSAGKRTTFTYDPVGNLLTATNELNQVTTHTYDHRNRRLTTTDAAGGVTTFAYDHNGNVTTATDPLTKVTAFTYDGEDRLKTVTDPTNRVTTHHYDDLGRLSRVTNSANEATTFEYDAAGQAIAAQDALGRRTTSAYDARGLLLTVTDPLHRTTTSTYNDVGRVASTKNPLNQTTTFAYDGMHRLLSATDPAGLVSSHGYNIEGSRTSLTNPANRATTFAYDVGGRLTGSTTPEGRAVTQAYDTRGNLATVVEPSNQTTTFTYDDAYRVSSIADPAGTLTFTRDAVGRTLTVTEGAKTLTREYNLRGELTKFTDGEGNILLYAYDHAGRLAKLTYPDLKEVSYGYDSAGRLQTVTDWASRVTTYSYDAAGQLTQILRPNGTKQTRAYDAAGQLTQLREIGADGTTVLHAADHGYDLAGRPSRDLLNPAVPALAYAATQTFDQDNRLLTHNGAGTTFDADGNLLTIAAGVAPANYTYDARNRLTAAGGLAYTYDAENRRVAVTQGSDVTSYVVNPHAVPDQVLVRTAPNGTKTFYVYGLGLLHEQTGSTLRYYHHDRRGDTVMLTDETGAVTDRMGYGLYGELAARTGTTDTPFLFNGRWGVQTDGNGLYYHRARYYHPALRRFLNQDSVLGEIAMPASLNRFAYANGEPVSLIDPFGLAAQDAQRRPSSFEWTTEPRTWARIQEGFNPLRYIRQIDEILEWAGNGVRRGGDMAFPGSGAGFERLFVALSFLVGPGEARAVSAAERGGSNIVYRALNAADAEALAAGRGLTAKASDGTWTAANHVANRGPGAGGAAANSPWISTTRNLDIARAYNATGNHGIVAIDLSKVSSFQTEVWKHLPRVNPSLDAVTGFAYHRSIWAQEITVFQNIPTSAILGPIK